MGALGKVTSEWMLRVVSIFAIVLQHLLLRFLLRFGELLPDLFPLLLGLPRFASLDLGIVNRPGRDGNCAHAQH